MLSLGIICTSPISRIWQRILGRYQGGGFAPQTTVKRQFPRRPTDPRRLGTAPCRLFVKGPPTTYPLVTQVTPVRISSHRPRPVGRRKIPSTTAQKGGKRRSNKLRRAQGPAGVQFVPNRGAGIPSSGWQKCTSVGRRLDHSPLPHIASRRRLLVRPGSAQTWRGKVRNATPRGGHSKDAVPGSPEDWGKSIKTGPSPSALIL